MERSSIARGRPCVCVTARVGSERAKGLGAGRGPPRVGAAGGPCAQERGRSPCLAARRWLCGLPQSCAQATLRLSRRPAGKAGPLLPEGQPRPGARLSPRGEPGRQGRQVPRAGIRVDAWVPLQAGRRLLAGSQAGRPGRALPLGLQPPGPLPRLRPQGPGPLPQPLSGQERRFQVHDGRPRRTALP